MYRKFRDKDVSSAARGLIGLFREINPAMLAKKDRGRGADLGESPQERGASLRPLSPEPSWALNIPPPIPERRGQAPGVRRSGCKGARGWRRVAAGCHRCRAGVDKGGAS